MSGYLIANLLILLANLGVLAINVKLYTEILKDRKFDSRADRTGHDGGRALGQVERDKERS